MRIDIETGIVTGGPPPLRHARTKGGKYSICVYQDAPQRFSVRSFVHENQDFAATSFRRLDDALRFFTTYIADSKEIDGINFQEV